MDNSDLLVSGPVTSSLLNMGSLGIGGIILVLFSLFVSWKSSKNKSINNRLKNINQKKEQVKNEIIKNDTRENVVYQEVKKDDKKQEIKEEEIKQKTDQISNVIAESLNQLDIVETVKRISNKWE